MSQTDCPSKYRLCNTRNYFILKLGNTANNNSIFNTKHAEFSTIRFPLYVSRSFFTNPLNHATTPTFLTNNAFLAWAIFNVPVSSLFLYLFKKQSRQSPSTLPFSTTPPSSQFRLRQVPGEQGSLWGITLF